MRSRALRTPARSRAATSTARACRDSRARAGAARSRPLPGPAVAEASTPAAQLDEPAASCWRSPSSDPGVVARELAGAAVDRSSPNRLGDLRVHLRVEHVRDELGLERQA